MPPVKQQYECTEKETLARIDERQKTQSALLEQIRDTVCGNGKAGLVVRVDRLEQARAGRRRILVALLGLVVVMVPVAVNATWAVIIKVLN